MGSKTTPILLVTANVGSIFEAPNDMLKIWCREFLTTVSNCHPKFIALHCQEVGGKNYEKSMKHVENFIQLLSVSEELSSFTKSRVYLDEDYSSAEHFTALGNLYFIHKSVENILLWDFKDCKFLPVEGKEIHSGNIESVVTKEKSKFPQDFFPECKWSRKGFLRTRWSLNGTIFDLINIHLFHDASNFIAMESFPSVYCKNRRRALEHTLQRFHNDMYEKVPYFIFGDFNFRTDTDGVVKKITEGLTTTRIQNHKNTDHLKMQFINDEDKLILSVGKKEFNHLDHQNIFVKPDATWLKCYDRELESFETYLMEYPIEFLPTYPFEEKISGASNYMQTRCPAWCDRVLLSHTAKQLVAEDQKVAYNLIGLETCMGDHKPVHLLVNLKENTGIVKCCDHPPYECLPASCQCCQSFASVTINVVDMSDYISHARENYRAHAIDSNLLHQPITKDMLCHEPYTPESIDSASPLPPNDKLTNGDKDTSPVSPKLLKSKLEDIIKMNFSSKIIERTTSEHAQVEKFEDGFFRNRSMSEMSKLGRARLISTDSGGNSIQRFQSHHSSSDEDWFEFHHGTKAAEGDRKDVDIKNEQNFDLLSGCARRLSNLSIEDNQRKKRKKNKVKNKTKKCCCIV